MDVLYLNFLSYIYNYNSDFIDSDKIHHLVVPSSIARPNNLHKVCELMTVALIRV